MSEPIERRGEVIGLARGLAQIRLAPEAGCSACGSRGSCAAGSAAAPVIEMPVPARTRLGDQLTVSLPPSSLTLAALLGYLLPPLCLLAGAMAAASAYPGDAAAVLGGGLGFVAGLLLARLLSRLVFGPAPLASLCRPDLPPGEHS